jgi:hypothetical protein
LFAVFTIGLRGKSSFINNTVCSARQIIYSKNTFFERIEIFKRIALCRAGVIRPIRLFVLWLNPVFHSLYQLRPMGKPGQGLLGRGGAGI